MTGAACRQIFRVLRRHLVRRTGNIRSEQEIDGAHDDGPTIKSKPVPTGVCQNSERFVSLSNISKSQCFKSAPAPQPGLWLTCGIGSRWANLEGFSCQIACPKSC